MSDSKMGSSWGGGGHRRPTSQDIIFILLPERSKNDIVTDL